MFAISKFYANTLSLILSLVQLPQIIAMKLKLFFQTRNKLARSITTPTSSPSDTLKPFEEIPGPKPLPLIGNIWRYFPLIGDYRIDTLYENAQLNKKKYGSLVREQITSRHTILHLFDPDDIIAFHRQDNKHPHRRSHRAILKYRRERPDLYRDGGLFPENGPNWFRQRVQFKNYLMNKSIVSKNIPKLDQVSKNIVDSFDERFRSRSIAHIDNFQDVINKWALANSLSLFLDLDIKTLDPETINVLMKNLNESLEAIDGTEIRTERWVNQPNKCPFYKQLTQSQDILHQFVQSKLELVSRDVPIDEFSYLNEWIHKDKLDLRDIVSFVMDSLHAGLHTTAYTFAFLMYHLSTNPEVLRELKLEIRENTSHMEPLTIEALQKMKLLRYCLKETLRVNPVSIGTGRLTHHDKFQIKNFQIPKGTMIIAHSQVINMDEKVYDEPEKFKPSRWIEKNAQDSRVSPFAYLPFGFGPRSCIGQRLSELQIEIMAIRLIQQYDIEFHSPIKTKTTLIHNIDGNISVTMKRSSTNKYL